MVDFAKAVIAYRHMRDARSALKKRYEQEDNIIKAQMDRLEAHMLQSLMSSNLMRASTSGGTVYRQVEFTPRVDDWEALYTHIKQTGNFDLLERRVGKTAVRRFMDTHAEMAPPGVSVMREWKIGVRKPTDKVENDEQ